MDTLLLAIPISKFRLKLEKEKEELRVSELINDAEERPSTLVDGISLQNNLPRF
jgi:hypothetical protein